MFKLDLILQIMNQIDHCVKEKSNWVIKRSVKWNNHDKVCWIKSTRPKTYIYLIEEDNEDKKTKDTKSVS